jgi:hypothetical protein
LVCTADAGARLEPRHPDGPDQEPRPRTPGRRRDELCQHAAGGPRQPCPRPELETGLLGHLQKFLLELGQGFAFVGRQYPIQVSDREFYLDLLFYHLRLRCFVVVELKKGDFKPEYAGKMNFYCSAVDDLLRHPGDAPTLGLILCQEKDRILAEYALRDIHKPIGIADYELTRALPAELASSLPSIESLEAELSADLPAAEPDANEGGAA